MCLNDNLVDALRLSPLQLTGVFSR